jgi:hypothetical protein
MAAFWNVKKRVESEEEVLRVRALVSMEVESGETENCAHDIVDRDGESNASDAQSIHLIAIVICW